MNKYLLLRDNKQTGPYTVEELVKKGLKPYDLVWLDGRSAAWRYPSEIDELKAFAPVVEEQPYDRFYKRSSSAQQDAVHSVQQQPIKQEQPLPVSKPVVKTGSGKVYVTLPAGFRQKQTAQQATAEETVKPGPVQAKKETAFPVMKAEGKLESGKQEEAGVSREAAKALEARAAALAESVQAAAAASKKQTAQQAIQQWDQQSNTSNTQPANSTVEQPANFSSLINKHEQAETIPVIPMRNQSGRKQLLLMRSIVAACLLLGGIVIGMALTNSKSSIENQKALDQLVQRLQEREAQRQAGINPEQVAGESTTPANSEEYAEESTPTVVEESHTQEKDPGQQLAVKDKQVPPVVNSHDAPVTFQEKDPHEMKVTQAVVTRKDEPRPVREADITAAREKIFQMVQVAASPFRTGVLGGISNLYFTVSNTSSFPLDQIELEIKYLGPENRVVKVQRLIFNDVGAGAQKTLEAPRTSRGVSIDYVVTKINSRALGIAHAGF
ncbi:DUF4339 domain-containing protein [Pseudoflavitalea rhizosphaerae]|uniref:DUF4339 domain-containing protein n=1 Tax=Pseudoflavitalea rhizosphaerae TaxID=1884793 RepID=UPI000F8EC080|nr:DUF4339 domain-containing protein [Pseudoflavitalea rhizosphaerae]